MPNSIWACMSTLFVNLISTNHVLGGQRSLCFLSTGNHTVSFDRKFLSTIEISYIELALPLNYQFQDWIIFMLARFLVTSLTPHRAILALSFYATCSSCRCIDTTTRSRCRCCQWLQWSTSRSCSRSCEEWNSRTTRWGGWYSQLKWSNVWLNRVKGNMHVVVWSKSHGLVVCTKLLNPRMVQILQHI
jgi:hypothetical protein